MRFTGIVLCCALFLFGCGSGNPNAHAHSVYLLIDTSGTYTNELEKAKQLINYILFNLQPGDFFAVARIDSDSFDEKDIIAKVKLEGTRTVANQQKQLLKKQIDKYVTQVKRSRYTDISGGMIQAVQYLKETRAGHQTLLVFSDLKEDLKKGYKRNFTFKMKNVKVIAINVTKLRSDNVDPRGYLKRVEQWRKKVEKGGGQWLVINDLENLDRHLNLN